MANYTDAWDDDDLDDLGDNQLAELENNAIQFTQQQPQQHHEAQPQYNNNVYRNRNSIYNARAPSDTSNYGDEDFEEVGVDAYVGNDHVYGKTFQPDEELSHAELVPDEIHGHYQNGNSNAIVEAKEQFRRDRYGADITITSHNGNQALRKSNGAKAQTQHIPNHKQDELEGETLSSNHPIPAHYDTDAIEALQRQVQELLRAQESYKSELSAKAGEIAIVRSKSEKTTKEYERELNTLKKLNAERIATQQKAIDTAREAEKTLATELEFVKKDLTEEVEKVRNLKRIKERDGVTEGKTEQVTTPKKKKVLADGFDDDEVMIISPTKFRGRSNGGTPTKASNKRKRKVQDSPVRALDLDVEEDKAIDQNHVVNTALHTKLVVEKLRVADDRLKFLESILAYRPRDCKHKILEEFAHISLPSKPGESFATFILRKLPTAQQPSDDFALHLCELFVTLWKKCLEEKFYQPISILVSVLTYAVELKTFVLSPYIIDTLLPVAQATVDIIAIPRFRRDISPHMSTIEMTPSLQLIHLLGSGCMSHREDTRRFWRIIRMDFFLMMLSLNQYPTDLIIIFQLLSMSNLKDTIGPIDARAPEKNASHLLDRMTYMFLNEPYTWPPPPSPFAYQPHYTSDEPIAPSGPKPRYPRDQTSKIRIAALRCITTFTQTLWGREAVAKHAHTIGRLFALLSEEIDQLYDNLPTHALSTHQINLIVRILHTLLISTPSVTIDLPAKLAPFMQGGTQKHILTLSRIYFAETDGLLERGIDECVQEMAKELVELCVTPEEGEAVYQAFCEG